MEAVEIEILSDILAGCPQNDRLLNRSWQMNVSAVVKQSHKSKIHMKLLVAVEQSEAGIVGNEINFRFLVTSEHNHVFENASGGRATETG